MNLSAIHPTLLMDERRPGDRLLLAAVIALHGAALLLLSRLPQELPAELALPSLLTATLIQMETPQPSNPLPQPAATTPQLRTPATPRPPVLTTSAATAVTAPVVEPEQRTEPVTPAAQTVADEPVAPPPQAPASVAQPEPLQPPRFDADYLDNPAPAYPSLSRRLREQGTVLLRVYVDASGAPVQIELKQSSGHARLDQTAPETVRRWRFQPARQGSSAVAGWVIVPISFILRN